MKVDQAGEIEVGEHIPVDHHEGVVDADVVGGEPDGPGGIQRCRLDRIGQSDSGDDA